MKKTITKEQYMEMYKEIMKFPFDRIITVKEAGQRLYDMFHNLPDCRCGGEHEEND